MTTERGQVMALRDAAPYELAAGVTMRPLFGDDAMLNLVELEPGARMEVHHYPHEQLGYVTAGELVLEIDGVEHILGAGDAFQIPGGTSHAASTHGPCTVLDVFHPVRVDLKEKVGA